jgi:flagellar basal-body rod protein FlgB
MSSIFLFNIASQRNQWLSVREAAITGNIANANTPGYTAVDVQPFEDVLQSSHLELARSNPQHVSLASQSLDALEEKQKDSWRVYNSGNSVSLEKEMVKAGEVNGAFSLTNGVVKAFHRMLLASTKG